MSILLLLFRAAWARLTFGRAGADVQAKGEVGVPAIRVAGSRSSVHPVLSHSQTMLVQIYTQRPLRSVRSPSDGCNRSNFSQNQLERGDRMHGRPKPEGAS